MDDSTYYFIIPPNEPIPIQNLEVVIEEGLGLNFSSRPEEAIALNEYWNKFIASQATERMPDFLTAVEKEDTSKIVKLVKSCSMIGSSYRLSQANWNFSKLTLALGITDFKEYIGTTQRALQDPQFRERLMTAGNEDANNPNHYFSNPIGCCISIVTSDGKIPVMTRSNTVAIYPGVPHIVGGLVDVNKAAEGKFSVKNAKILETPYIELKEETGLSREDVEQMDFLGIVRNIATRYPEMMYVAHVRLDSQKLLESWHRNSPDKEEHNSISFYSPGELKHFINKNKGKIVPTGEAALVSYLQLYAQQ